MPDTYDIGALTIEDDGTQILFRHKSTTVCTMKNDGLTINAGIDGNTTLTGTLTSTGQAATPTITTAKVTLTNAQIKAMAASPIELVEPQGASTVIELVSMVMQLVAGSEVLTESTDNMQVKYNDDSGLAASAAIEATGFIDQATNTYQIVQAAGPVAGTVAQMENKRIVLDNTGGEYAGNASDDATMNIWVSYRVHDVS